MKLDYERDTKIDHDSLDIEWLEQADLARRYGKHLASKKRLVNRLEEEKKLIRSQLIDFVNRNPEEATGKKSPNAADIEAYYRRQNKYQDKVDELLDAQEELEYVEAVTQEIAWTKKKALENLVILHGQQYFAGPSMPRNISKEWEKKQQQRKANETVKITRK